MIRLIGILTGSALGIAILILVFGLPDLSPRVDDSVAEALNQPPAEPADAEAPPVEDVSPQPELPPSAEPAAAAPLTEAFEMVAPPEPLTEAPAEAVVPVSSTAVPQEDAASPPLPVEERPAAMPAARNWYAFWSPFRSRIAADGFVAELQRTTGLDYRVVKLKPGIYEVAFAYTDDADIQDKLDRISAATGMDMSGG